LRSRQEPRAGRRRKPAEADTPTAPAAASGVVPATPETIYISQGAADQVAATNIDVDRGAIGRAQATDIAVSRGAIGLAQGERVSAELGAVGAAFGTEVRVTQGAVYSVVAREARLEQTFVRTLIANEVKADRTTGVLVLLARRVEGDVRTIIDWRGALAFGAAFGIVSALLRRGRR